MLARFKLLDPQTQTQMIKISTGFIGDVDLPSKEVRNATPEDYQKIKAVAVLEKNTVMGLVALKSLFNTIRGYCEGQPDFVPVSHIVKPKPTVALIEGYLDIPDNPVPVVCKLYESSSGARDITHELAAGKTLRNLKCGTAWITTKYSILNKNVLIMEKLFPLPKSVDWRKVGIDILRQLKVIHTVGVHCDIKPGNIMMRKEEISRFFLQPEDPTYDFTLIDFGGMTFKEVPNPMVQRYQEEIFTISIPLLGVLMSRKELQPRTVRPKPCKTYERFTWTPNFSTQRRMHSTPRVNCKVCSTFHDLLELGLSLNYITLDQAGVKATRVEIIENIDSGLYPFMRILLSYDPYEMLPEDIYDRLIDSLGGWKAPEKVLDEVTPQMAEVEPAPEAPELPAAEAELTPEAQVEQTLQTAEVVQEKQAVEIEAKPALQTVEAPVTQEKQTLQTVEAAPVTQEKQTAEAAPVPAVQEPQTADAPAPVKPPKKSKKPPPPEEDSEPSVVVEPRTPPRRRRTSRKH